MNRSILKQNSQAEVGSQCICIVKKREQCTSSILISVLSAISRPSLYCCASLSTSGLIILMMSKPLSSHYSHITEPGLVISDAKASCLPEFTNFPFLSVLTKGLIAIQHSSHSLKLLGGLQYSFQRTFLTGRKKIFAFPQHLVSHNKTKGACKMLRC